MPYDQERHHRRTIRWEGYDYALAGAYVVTIVTAGRKSLFGTVVDDEMIPNEIGKIVEEEWWRSAEIRPEMTMDAFIVMPNHLHGIVTINRNVSESVSVGAHGCAPGPHEAQSDWETIGSEQGKVRTNGHRRTKAGLQQGRAHGRVPLRAPRTLGSFVAGFKSAATTRINVVRGTPRMPVWQRGYHDRVIRGQDEHDKFCWYIEQNPATWLRDREYAASYPRYWVVLPEGDGVTAAIVEAVFCPPEGSSWLQLHHHRPPPDQSSRRGDSSNATVASPRSMALISLSRRAKCSAFSAQMEQARPLPWR